MARTILALEKAALRQQLAIFASLFPWFYPNSVSKKTGDASPGQSGLGIMHGQHFAVENITWLMPFILGVLAKIRLPPEGQAP
ncbi:MAG: hypothetical protein KJ927_09550 [Candidatus Eisenbacteria bacterium]|nr:hypothetical protein [Candidatus Eisenbacteria bacterium]MBU1948944.1 hypothetical protein [Candidatus Eisenbacteria bacterium]